MGNRVKKRKDPAVAEGNSLATGPIEANGGVQKKARHPKKTAPPLARCWR